MPEHPEASSVASRQPTAPQLAKKIEKKANFDYSYDLAMFQIWVTTIIGVGIFLLQQKALDTYTILALIVAFATVFIIYEWKFRGHKRKLQIDDV